MGQITLTNWMSETPGLLNKKLSEIMIPGTHHSESMTLEPIISPCNALGSGFLAGLSTGLGLMVPGIIIRNLAICQNTSVLSQLMSGVRYFDFRVCREKETGVYRTQHTVLGAETIDGLQQMAQYLSMAKSELILLEISFDGGNDEDLISLIDQYLGPYLFSRPENSGPLFSYNLGDIVGYNNGDSIGKSKVVLLYPNDAYVNSTYPYLWSFKSEINDIYKGFTDVDDLENYLENQLEQNTSNLLTKLQYILEWQGGQNPFQSLEHFERALPGRLPDFLASNQNHRINIVFVDFIEKLANFLLPYIIVKNGGSENDLAPTNDPNIADLSYYKTYQITSLLSPDYGVFCVTLQDDGSLALKPADPLNPRQHWRLRRNLPYPGASLYCDDKNVFINIEDATDTNRSRVSGSSQTSDTTGLQMVKREDGYVIRSFINEDANLESNGDNGGDNCVVDTWNWDDTPNQRWLITDISKHLVTPFGIELYTNYAITVGFISQSLALTCRHDEASGRFTITVETLDPSDADQYWTPMTNGANGIALFNAKNAAYLTAGSNIGNGVYGSQQQDQASQGFGVPNYIFSNASGCKLGVPNNATSGQAVGIVFPTAPGMTTDWTFTKVQIS